jgi:hypothetical protein
MWHGKAAFNSAGLLVLALDCEDPTKGMVTEGIAAQSAGASAHCFTAGLIRSVAWRAFR